MDGSRCNPLPNQLAAAAAADPDPAEELGLLLLLLVGEPLDCPAGAPLGDNDPGPGQPGNMPGDKRENCCSKELAAELDKSAVLTAGPPDVFLVAVLAGRG